MTMKLVTANARSILNKIESLGQNFDDLEIDFALVTETWLREGRAERKGIRDIEESLGLSMVQKGRRNRNGRGVDVIYRDESVNFKRYNFKTDY